MRMAVLGMQYPKKKLFVALINSDVIITADLADFSDELKESVDFHNRDATSTPVYPPPCR